MKRWNVTPALFTVITLSAATALVAAPPKTEQPNKNPKAGNSAAKSTDQQASWKVTDQMLASCVAIDNQGEIALSQFALQHAKHADVKKFAEMMVADHQEFLKKLEQYAPEASRENFLKTATTEAGEKNPAKPNVITRTAAKPPIKDDAAHADAVEPMALMRELAQQCLADSQAMLTEKKEQGDAHFDNCFIGLQIAKHMAMKTKLKVYHKHASGELAELFAAGLETTTAHCEEAEKLMEKLAESTPKTAAAE